MTSAPEIPYTDRNVREDPSLTTWAYEYLKKYGGSFEPLVNAQELLVSEGGLPTNVIRVVLNCMRHDTTIASHLPKPTPYVTSIPALANRKKTKYSEYEYISCGSTEPHSWHSHKVNDEYFQCEGIPFPINRRYFNRPCTVKIPYARARTGKFWHHVNTDRNVSYIEWYPPGLGHIFGYAEPVLVVKTICKYPSTIRQPILMPERPSERFATELLLVAECPHCIDVLQTPKELQA